MTIDALQAAMKLSNWIEDNQRRASVVTVETIIKEEKRMLFKGRMTCSDPISIDQACEIIGQAQGKDRVSRPTVYRYIRKGQLKKYHVANRTMLSRSRVIEFVKAIEA